MSKTLIFPSLVFSILVSVSTVNADEAVEPEVEVVPEPKEAEAAPEVAGEKPAAVELTVGTKLYDAATVEDLFVAYQAENKKRAEENAHLNPNALETIELGPMHVEAYHIRNFNDLANKIDPQPRRRLNRLADLDPEAAAELRVSMRSEERFFAGEGDATRDMNAGSTANVDFRKVGESVNEALARAKKAMRSKKVTDDQVDVSTGGE